jgi:hypothetical protein
MNLPESIDINKKRMVNYVVYDAIGRILRTGTCPYGWLYGMAGENELVLEGVASDSINWIDVENKQIIDKPTDIKNTEDVIKQKALEKEELDMVITQKMNDILKKMAIDELKKEGTLDKDGKLVK